MQEVQPESNELTVKTSAAERVRLVGTEYQSGAVLGGKYQVISLLGIGGMGVVYRVNQIFLNQEFALKTIDKRHISDVTIRRFQQEARAAFAVDHPNLIAVKDFGLLDDQTPFLVMEIINGETLGERLKKTGCLTVDEAIPIFVQVCFGLAYAHQTGIVHRDIKPNNIMLLNGLPLGAEGAVKIVDFGIAKFGQHEGGEIQALTRTGEIFGSPLYMSPEQCAGERVDHRADIYSLGCVLFEALTGTPPCVGENALSTMMQHQSAAPPTLKEASFGSEFSRALENIVATMLAKSPASRYQNLGIVAQDLGALRRGESISTARPSQNQIQAKAKTISMASNKFYALLFGLAVVAGVFGYLLRHIQDGIAPVASERQPSSGLSNNMAIVPFTRTEKRKDGKKFVTFHFPRGQDLGSFEVLYSSYEASRIVSRVIKEATGEVTFEMSPSVLIVFRPSEFFLQDPTHLKMFKPNDLFKLQLTQGIPEGRASQLMQVVGGLIGLRCLGIGSSNAVINDDALGEIAKLPKLQALFIRDTKITGAALAKLANLKQITVLHFSQCKGAGELLKSLQHNDQLTELDLDKDSLTPADFNTIGTIAGLQTLRVNTTGMKNADLSSLVSLTNLVNLEVKDCPLSKDAIPWLKIMAHNGLKKLSLSADGFSPIEVDLITKMLPPGGAYFKVTSREDPLGVGNRGAVSDEKTKEGVDLAREFLR